MAYSEYLAERVRKRLTDPEKVKEIKMMGCLIFMVNGKMCLGVEKDKKTGQDHLMVRVGKLPYEELLKEKVSSPMAFAGKPMRGFLLIEPEGFDSEKDLEFWINQALVFNQILINQ